MIVSREAFDKAQKKADEKWTRGCECTEENFEEWWAMEGEGECSFCATFDYGGDYCDGCPISRKWHCAIEFKNCKNAYSEQDFPKFHRNALALRRKIRKLDYDKYVKRAKRLGLE